MYKTIAPVMAALLLGGASMARGECVNLEAAAKEIPFEEEILEDTRLGVTYLSIIGGSDTKAANDCGLNASNAPGEWMGWGGPLDTDNASIGEGIGTRNFLTIGGIRFERGIDPAFMIEGAEIASDLILGICGGYQMLGKEVRDPDGVESTQAQISGLRLLPMTTIFAGSKETHRVTGKVALNSGLLAGAKGLPVQGYEIHMGRTAVEGVGGPFAIDDRSDLPVTQDNALDGPLDSSGWVLGTYIHGLFHNGGLRRALLQALARRKGVTLPPADEMAGIDGEFDKLADWVRGSLNMDLIYQMSGLARDFDSVGSGR